MTETDDTPRFSAVVCTYNGAQTIAACLQSLLRQEFDHGYEVIVVDDGSTDGTVEAVQELDSSGIHLVQHDTNRGLSAARNTGWQSANGEFVAYIDDDAVAPADWLQSLYDRYDEGVAGVGGYPASWTDSPLGRYEVARAEVIYGANAENADGAGGMNMSFRRSVLEEIGGFDERFTHIGDDADLNRRLRRAGFELVVDTSIRVRHKFPQSVRGFTRKKFRRGLGRVLVDRKYGEENPPRTVLAALLQPLLFPYALYLAVQYDRRTAKSDFLWFALLSYLDRVASSWGELYYLLSE